jgi:hypothetical protein
MSDHGLLLSRLAEIVHAVCTDPVLRRALRYRPAEGVEALRLCGPAPPSGLGVRHHEVSVFIDSPTTLGAGIADGRPPPPEHPLDLRLLLYGTRPAALVHGLETEVAALAAWARSHGLVALMSPHEFDADPRPGGFADLGGSIAPARAGSGRWRGLVISHSADTALLIWLALLFRWDAYLGVLLGYPACCSLAFERRWPAASESHRGDVAAALLAEAGAGGYAGRWPWQANVYARSLGTAITMHFPCKLDCPATAELAERHLAALATHEPGARAALEDDLRQPVLVSADLTASLRDAALEQSGDTLVVRYRPELARTNGDEDAIARLLSHDTLVAPTDSGEVRLGGIRGPALAGWLVSFASSETEESRDAVPVGA